LRALDALLAECLSPDLAPHCRAARLEGNVLTLIAESSAWATRLRYQAGAIISHFSTRPDIDIRQVKVKTGKRRIKRPPRKKRKAEISTANRKAIARGAAGINDPKLRQALLRLAGGGRPKR
jgi:hypothetical protein